VTLINALPAKYGGIILADSQETVEADDGEWKYSVLKIEPHKINDLQFVIAGGGDGEAIEALIERIRRKLAKDAINSIPGFRDLFEREAKSTLRELRKLDSAARLHFIVAVQTNKEFEIWHSTSHTLVPIRRDRPTLLGYTSHLYQHVANSLFSPGLPAGHLLAIGLRVLELARQSCTCVDLPYSGAVVSRTGIAALDKPLLDELTQSVVVFSAALDRLMLMCADTTVKKAEFIDGLAEFQQTAIRLRTENLQKVAELEIHRKQENGIGYGMSFIPEETLTTVVKEKDGRILVDIREGWGDIADALASRLKARPETTPSTPQKSEPEQ